MIVRLINDAYKPCLLRLDLERRDIVTLRERLNTWYNEGVPLAQLNITLTPEAYQTIKRELEAIRA